MTILTRALNLSLWDFMKTPKSWWIGCCLFGSLSMLLVGQPATQEFDPLGEHDNLPKLLRVHLEFIEMPQETLTKLMQPVREGADDTKLRAEVGELIAKGEASVIETSIGMSRSGQKSTFESVREFIYPTEYMEVGAAEDEKETEKGAGDSKDTARGLRVIGSAFETRNLGTTLEIEPTLGENNKIVDLRLTPEITYHVGNETWTEWKDSKGDASVRLPAIYTLRVNTATTMEVGKPQMIAALSPKGENGITDQKRKVMVFLRCDVLTVGR